MLKAQDLLAWGTQRLIQSKIPSPRKEARLLLQNALHMDDGQFLTLLFSDQQDVPSEPYKSWVHRRCLYEPLAYILGHKEFWSLSFALSKDTLIPRPDSETIIETLLRYRKEKEAHLSFLDFGTGCGCLLIAALKEYKHSTGVGVDKNQGAVKIATENLTKHKLRNRAQILYSNWDDALLKEKQFDIILANPPYIPTNDIDELERNVRDFELIMALDGGHDGLEEYRLLFQKAALRLRPGGLAFFEIGIEQGHDVCELASKEGLIVKEIVPDLGGIERVIVVQKKGEGVHH